MAARKTLRMALAASGTGTLDRNPGGGKPALFLLGDALMPWIVKPYNRRQFKERENSKLQDLQRQEGSGECV